MLTSSSSCAFCVLHASSVIHLWIRIGMCCGCAPSVAFSWLGALLINLSFIALISWGTAVLWPLGLSFAAIYAGLLFFAAKKLASKKDVAVTVDILLLIFVVAVGATGSILAYNVVGCDAPLGASYSGNQAAWIFPSAADPLVTSWAAQNRYALSAATFAFVPSAGVTYFSARNATSPSQGLWHAAGSTTPVRVALDLENPGNLVASATGVCFTAYEPALSRTGVYCLRTTTDTHGGALLDASGVAPANPSSLLVTSTALWFKADAPFGTDTGAGVVYRSDPPHTSAILISVASGSGYPAPPPPSSPGASGSVSCDSTAGFQATAVAMLFLAVLPALFAASLIAYKMRTPSMVVALYGGLFAAAINIYAIARPDGSGAFDFIKWWHAIGGGVWLLGFVSFKLAGRGVVSAAQTYAISIGSLALFAAMHAVTEVPFTTDALSWIAYNVLCTLPLLLLTAIAAGTSAAGLPMLFACSGLLMDAWKVTDELTKLVQDGTLQVFIRFLTLGAVGAGVVVAGLQYQQRRKAIEDAVETLAASVCGPCRPRSEQKRVGI